MNVSANTAVKITQKDYVACAYLFSPEHAKTRGFVQNLKLNTVKKAFREKAKRYHPDLNGNDNKKMLLKRQERFIKIKMAYEYLFLKLQNNNSFIEKKPNLNKPKKAKIIAVGGAKGGIGKSVFASNLSVYLSSKGFDTVAADFDLGGSNLHLYLGKTRIRKNINDYLSKDVKDLKDIIEDTKYGPRLIGGNSSQLGTANLSFTQKLKLLKAVRKIDADYVIMDLGGSTSYNVLDFFLAADLGIVMTTCDPASYLEAYSFIKVALYRKLNRLFGPESMYSGKIDTNLKKLIHETTMSKNDPNIGDIEGLISKIREEHPDSMNTIKSVLSDFTPQLIVNKITDEKSALEPVRRIQEVSRKKLSINVGHLCSLPYQSEIERSVRTLVPWVSEVPDSKFQRKIEGISTKLMDIRPRVN
jgi:flagellar biosynthesis protein FlhG